MNDSGHGGDSNRIEEILRVLMEFAAGNFLARVSTSDRNDPIDGVVTGLNMLGEEYGCIEQERQESERRYRTLAENLPGVVYRTYPLEGGRTEFFNQMLQPMTGYGAEELDNCSLGQVSYLIHPEDRERVQEEKGYKVALGETFEVAYRIYHKDGSERWFKEHGRGIPGVDGQIQYVDGVILDVTEERTLAAKLQHSQQMKALGTLAGGVAHDMNNVLTVVLGLSSLLESELEEDDPKLQDVQQIKGAARRGQSLVKNLLGFARRGKYQQRKVSLNRTVKELVAVLQRTIPKRIVVDTALEPALADIDCDPSQVSHAIMNLCLNSADAIEGRGRITLITRNTYLDESSPKNSSLEAGRYVELQVVDDGMGMDQETTSRAFEPFFTTKDVGKGTGLGLSMVYGTVENHGGAASLTSTEGQGTVVTLLFPAAIDEVAEGTARYAKPAPQRGRGKLLVVDDESYLRDLAQRLLGPAGYQVLLAEGGQQALEVYGKAQGSIDLVLLDLSMPEMDGEECFARLQQQDPEVRVLICTGHGSNEAVEKMIGQGALGLICKPFVYDELWKAVAAALGEVGAK